MFMYIDVNWNVTLNCLLTRSRRRRARELKDIMGHHDGLSSDDEENQSEIAKYNVEKGGTFTHNFLCWLMTVTKCSIDLIQPIYNWLWMYERWTFPFWYGRNDWPIDSHVCWDQWRCLLLWGSAHLMLLFFSGLRDYTPMRHVQEYDFLCIVIKLDSHFMNSNRDEIHFRAFNLLYK